MVYGLGFRVRVGVRVRIRGRVRVRVRVMPRVVRNPFHTKVQPSL